MKIDQGLIKFFKGDRYDLLAKINTERIDPGDIFAKNASSLFMVVFKTLDIQYTLLNNLSAKLETKILDFDLTDTRHNSEIDPASRKIVASFISKFYNPDEDSTVPENLEDIQPSQTSEYEINLDKTVNKVAQEVYERNVIKEENEKIFYHQRDQVLPLETLQHQKALTRADGEGHLHVVKTIGLGTKIQFGFKNLVQRLKNLCRRKKLEQLPPENVVLQVQPGQAHPNLEQVHPHPGLAYSQTGHEQPDFSPPPHQVYYEFIF